jgi:hypothetical protein
LIDESRVRFNHFTGDGAEVSPELNELPEVAALCAATFEAVWPRAILHERYTV